MNINISSELAVITLSERNISHMVGANEAFIGSLEPFLKRMCEDGTLLIVAVNDDVENPKFEKFGNVVTATVPPSTLKELRVVPPGTHPTHDAYAGEGGVMWVLIAELDDEHYERREAGPGFEGII